MLVWNQDWRWCMVIIAACTHVLHTPVDATPPSLTDSWLCTSDWNYISNPRSAGKVLPFHVVLKENCIIVKLSQLFCEIMIMAFIQKANTPARTVPAQQRVQTNTHKHRKTHSGGPRDAPAGPREGLAFYWFGEKIGQKALRTSTYFYKSRCHFVTTTSNRLCCTVSRPVDELDNAGFSEKRTGIYSLVRTLLRTLSWED